MTDPDGHVVSHWFYKRSLSGIVSSNPGGGHGCLVSWMSCVLRRAYQTSKEVLLNVVWLIVVEKPYRGA